MNCVFVRQARPLQPSMFMAQEPQIPSREDLQKVRVGSISFLILVRASSTMGPHSLRLISYSLSSSFFGLSGFHR
ncbi:hypothetical protein ACFX2I_038836 [Malus domestica]